MAKRRGKRGKPLSKEGVQKESNTVALRDTKEIIVLTGARGAGKSTGLARYCRPSELHKMVVIDTEGSMSDILARNKRMGVSFGRYIQAYERWKPNEDILNRIAAGNLPWSANVRSQHSKTKIRGALLDYWDWFRETLDKVLDNGYEYLAIDTIEPIEAAMTAWAEKNPKLSGWTGKTAFGGLEVEAIRPLYDMLLDGIRRRGIHTILLSTHIGPQWMNKEMVPGKVKMNGRLKILSQFSTFMGWVLPHVGNPKDEPACAVLKCRWGDESIDKVADEWADQRPSLPERIPVFNWKNVRAYRDGEIEWSPINPAPGEKLSQAEREMIEPTLYRDAQMELMILGAERDKVVSEQEQLLSSTASATLFADSDNGEKKMSPRQRRLAKQKESGG